MSGAEGFLVPIVGSILGGMFGGGQDSSPTMEYSQPPPGQIDPMFEPGMQDLVNIWRNQLFSNPTLNSIMTGQGYLGSLFSPGQGPQSLFGQPVPGQDRNFSAGSPQTGVNMGPPPVPQNPTPWILPGQQIGRPPM